MTSLISKARKPKFDLHLRIYDLNNVPLVSGVSLIKWHLPHSIHKEHRGRTQKCPIANHRVEYNHGKVVPVRIAIDKTGNLAECWIEFEVLQEFNAAGSSTNIVREEKVSLGIVRINLSEYIEESEAILRDESSAANRRTSFTVLGSVDKAGHQRKRSSMSGITVGETDTSPRSSHPPSELEEERSAADVQEGVVRRYLMQESKINSTLKISILMIQVDGERNFVAPPLKTAPVFGGIAGFVANESLEPPDVGTDAPGRVPSLSNKSRDTSEVQDMYRRALAASWASQPGELPADQCIEDIFAGGDGFRSSFSSSHATSRSHPLSLSQGRSTGGMGNSPQSTGSSGNNIRREDSGETSGDEENGDTMGTLRPRDMHRIRHRLRGDSAASDRSNDTLLGEREPHSRDRGISGINSASHRDLSQLGPHVHYHRHRRDISRDTDGGGLRSRSGSATSLATTLGSSERGRDGFKRAREVDEFDVREDMVAWAVQGARS
ncbi:N-terminal C2 in EEIG1 and EHBP1 proteins-domain-containing protein [Cercophora newfieldiana]|uniref:N-terminal C2 in EEIG1 and EHBP1 proteins-domain-containing protein n=1 Tax=Cercophora newfieldiana TaxID=92897 RepID=A0AA40D0J3_9PEZI|nr:N-terminal C2 in EEIG1 and EHBP1 proteins-domain-containing protein [Cercophora newfieldiana]